MRYTIILSLALSVSLSALGWERNEADLQHIAGRQLESMNISKDVPAKVSRILDKEMIAVYGSDRGGFVVVSRSSSTPAVIGYSDSSFNPEFIPDGLEWWLSEADRSIKDREKITDFRAPESEVTPLLTTLWAQDSPYNSLCPQTGGFWGSSPQTGCVAAAVAQVLKYYNYPEQSTGTGYYSTDGQTLKSASMSTVYDWEHMRNSYTYGFTEQEKKAVAELMRDCGYASKMVYTAQGSGANLYDAAYGLAHNMKYDSLSMRVKTRSYYHDEDWIKMIYDELQAKRPVIYAGTDLKSLAHCFVLDGLDTRGFVHVNWGWSGTANGYFDISSINGLNPSYPDPYTGSEIKYNFSSEHLMITGLNPSETPAEGAEYESFFGSYEVPDMIFSDDSLLIHSIPVFNFSHLDFTGLLGLVIQGEDGHAVVQPFFYSRWENGLSIPVLGGLNITEEYYPAATLNDTDGTTPRPDGKYRFYFVSWSDQEMASGINPRPFRYPASLAPDGEEPIAIWEAEKKNGHWDAESLKMVGDNENSAVKEVATDASTESDGVYTLDGLRLSDAGEISAVLGSHKPMIVRQNGKTYKILK